LSFNVKVSELPPYWGPVEMNLNYTDYFGITPKTGYQTLEAVLKPLNRHEAAL
jgi:hypothetical protein